MAQAKSRVTRKNGRYYKDGKRIPSPTVNAAKKGTRASSKKTGSTDSG